MAPRYVDDSTNEFDAGVGELLVERAAQKPAKPWTLVSEVASEADHDEGEVRTALRTLTLRGDLTPTSTGEIRATNVSRTDR